MYPDGSAEAVHRCIPDMLHQFLLAHRSAQVEQQIFQNSILFSCQALKQLISASPLWRGEYPFGLAFYTKYARLCNLDDFVKVYGANFWLGLEVLFTCALVCYILAWIMQKVNEKTSARLDLFADVTVIAVLIVDFISNLYCFKAHVYAEQSTVLYFVDT